MTHKSINTFIWKVNADIFYIKLPLLIIAWGKNPNKLSYLKLIAHVIGALRWQPALALGEVQHCDVRGGHNRCQSDVPKQNTATKTSFCLSMLYFQSCGIYIWSACKNLRVFSFEFNETENKHLQLPVYTHGPTTLSRSMMTTERIVTLATRTG